ncbi:AAA family ATPase [Pseudactinotalea sp. HY158]|nr:AAA family ATPase [Pseudactinotalea sp. HY158]
MGDRGDATGDHEHEVAAGPGVVRRRADRQAEPPVDPPVGQRVAAALGDQFHRRLRDVLSPAHSPRLLCFPPAAPVHYDHSDDSVGRGHPRVRDGVARADPPPDSRRWPTVDLDHHRRSLVTMAASSPPPTLRGRGAEMNHLGRALERVLTGQSVRVLIEGEGGIGKSRLLAETLTLARAQGFEVVTAKGDEVQQTRPFGVIADALGCVRTATDTRRRDIAELLTTHEHTDRGTITVSSDPGLQFRAVDALSDLVEALAVAGPLVVGLDDLHWADPSSLLTLAAIERAIEGLPVLLIACYRPFPRSRSLTEVVARLGAAGAVRLRPGPLDESDVAGLVAEVVGADPGGGLVAQASAAAGNPLFLIELLDSIMREGGLHRSDGRADIGDRSLPASLRLTILRRLSALPEAALRALRAGSLLGSSFSPDELAAVVGGGLADLAPALETALDSGVLEEDGDHLHFRHDLIREAVYADIPASLRHGLHRDAATRLAATGAPAARVAEQFTRGAFPGDPEAIDWLIRAARGAASSAPETAAAHLARAAELMTPGDGRLDLLLSERADALMLAGSVVEAVTSCRSLLRRPHDARAEDAVRLRLGAALLVNGRPGEALRELDVVVGSADASAAQRASALSESATARMWLADFDGADDAARRAYELAEAAGSRRFAAAAQATRSVVACMRGHMAGAMELNDQALDLAERSYRRDGHGYPVYATRGWILVELDQPQRAHRVLDEGRSLSEELGVRWPLVTYQSYLAVVRFAAGEWDDAAAELEAGIGLAEESGVTYALKPSYSALALIRLHRGDLAGARSAVDAAETIGDRGSRLFDHRVRWARALLREAEGDPAGAYRMLAAGWRGCRAAGMAVDYAVIGPDLVRLARAAGDLESAEEVTRVVTAVASANDVASISGAALRCRALLRDDADAANGAIDAYVGGARRLEAALVREEAAGLAAAQGRRDDARALLREAAAVFEGLGATRCVVRVDAALRRLGVRRGSRGPRRRPDRGWASLTETESRIADLVAEGLTNPQIAGRLYVSRRTVQTHVSHVFTKLGISSRAQLATQVTQHRNDALAGM